MRFLFQRISTAFVVEAPDEAGSLVTLRSAPRFSLTAEFPREVARALILILVAFITGNSSLEPLIEGLCAQIHVKLS